jgi:hypothetical protein
MEMVWRGQPSVQSRTIDTHISRIRRHLMIQPENGYRLVAAYGTGYRLDRICETWSRRSSPSICRAAAAITRGRSAPRSDPVASGRRPRGRLALDGPGSKAGQSARRAWRKRRSPIGRMLREGSDEMKKGARRRLFVLPGPHRHSNH